MGTPRERQISISFLGGGEIQIGRVRGEGAVLNASCGRCGHLMQLCLRAGARTRRCQRKCLCTSLREGEYARPTTSACGCVCARGTHAHKCMYDAVCRLASVSQRTLGDRGACKGSLQAR